MNPRLLHLIFVIRENLRKNGGSDQLQRQPRSGGRLQAAPSGVGMQRKKKN
jgi:hypothetical protein